MEDLQSLMTCLDEISGQISDGMYLKMTDKFKRVYDKLNGDKPFHEDEFYYSDTASDDESDSDYGSPRPAVRAPFAPNLDRTRLSDIALLRDQLSGSCEEDARGVQGSHEVGKRSEAYLDSQSSV